MTPAQIDPEDVIVTPATDSEGDPVATEIVNASARLTDGRLAERLIGVIQAGTPLDVAAEQLGLEVPAAMRVVMRHPQGKKALQSGEATRVHRFRATCQGHTDEAIRVIREVMANPDEEGKVRLNAAEKMIKYAGLYNEGNKSRGVSVDITGGEFAARLRVLE